jgi:hypothetical protein
MEINGHVPTIHIAIWSHESAEFSRGEVEELRGGGGTTAACGTFLYQGMELRMYLQEWKQLARRTIKKWKIEDKKKERL